MLIFYLSTRSQNKPNKDDASRIAALDQNITGKTTFFPDRHVHNNHIYPKDYLLRLELNSIGTGTNLSGTPSMHPPLQEYS